MQHHLLEVACRAVEQEAKSELGHYQQGAGPFATWEPLAPSTIAKKGADDPLLETGALKASITHEVHGDTGEVGTDDPKAQWLELGTSQMPPRSFLGLAAYRLSDKIAEMVGVEYTMFLAGQSRYAWEAKLISGNLGVYLTDFETQQKVVGLLDSGAVSPAQVFDPSSGSAAFIKSLGAPDE